MSAALDDTGDGYSNTTLTGFVSSVHNSSSPTRANSINNHRTSNTNDGLHLIKSPDHSVALPLLGQRDEDRNKGRKREIFKYKSDWLVSSLAWCNSVGEPFCLALASYINEYKNYIRIITLDRDSQDCELIATSQVEHPYPATKVSWIPNSTCTNQTSELFATTGDSLRIWRSPARDTSIYGPQNPPATKIELLCLLKPNQGSKHCAPLTSFEWNEIDPRIILTSSVDTTCAIWDVEVQKLIQRVNSPQILSSSPDGNQACQLRNQILAHNHEVYDVAFLRAGTGREVFVSAGGDGSIRLFDLRNLSTLTVLYETNPASDAASKALVRVAASKRDENLISFFAMNSNEIGLIDLRRHEKQLPRLSCHTDQLNAMSWAPHSAQHLVTASNDRKALIWDMTRLTNPVIEPVLAYQAEGKINAISWSTTRPDWISIGQENFVELLRV